MLYPQAGSHFRQKAIRLAQNSFLHVAHRRARCLLIRTIGEIGQRRQCIALIIIFRHKPLCKLFAVRPESILHNCCPELVGKEDELPLTDNQESNALLQRIATCSTANSNFSLISFPRFASLSQSADKGESSRGALLNREPTSYITVLTDRYTAVQSHKYKNSQRQDSKVSCRCESFVYNRIC